MYTHTIEKYISRMIRKLKFVKSFLFYFIELSYKKGFFTIHPRCF